MHPRQICKLAEFNDYMQGLARFYVRTLNPHEIATCWYQPQADHLAQDSAATDAACLLLTPFANHSIPAKSTWI